MRQGQGRTRRGAPLLPSTPPGPRGGSFSFVEVEVGRHPPSCPQGLPVSPMEPPLHLVAWAVGPLVPQEGAPATLVLVLSASLSVQLGGFMESMSMLWASVAAGLWWGTAGGRWGEIGASGQVAAQVLAAPPLGRQTLRGQLVQPGVGRGAKAPGVCVAQWPPGLWRGHSPQRAGSGVNWWSLPSH